MQSLRNLSARPTLLVDSFAFKVADADGNLIGIAGPLGRQRLVSALPLADGPVTLEPAEVVHDADLAYLADPDGTLIGVPGVRVARLLDARWVLDTRRLG